MAPDLDAFKRNLDTFMEIKVHHRLQGTTTICNLWAFKGTLSLNTICKRVAIGYRCHMYSQRHLVSHFEI